MGNRFRPRRTHIPPPKIMDTETLHRSASRRRQALIAGGCSTYIIGYRGGRPGIVCLCCGLGSSNTNDIQERYCGFCRQTHSEER